MQSNRIQHFLYTNNIPTGLNYQTDILMSLIHIEGSEYPYSLLPNNLPVYVGDLRDSLTKMMTGNNDFVSQECLDKFKNAFCQLESKLADINIRIKKAYEKWIDDMIEALFNYASMWGRASSNVTLINIPQLLCNLFAEEFNSPEEYNNLVAAGVVFTVSTSALDLQLSRMKADLIRYTSELANNELRMNQIINLLGGTGGNAPDWWTVRTNMTNARRLELLKELNNLRLRQGVLKSLIRSINLQFPGIVNYGTNVSSAKNLSKEWVKRARKGSVSLDIIRTIASGLKNILSKLWALIKSTFGLILTGAIVCSLGFELIEGHKKLGEDIGSANDSWDYAIKYAIGEGLDYDNMCKNYPSSLKCAEQEYENQMNDLIKSGCCDKDSNCIGASDNNDGSGGDYSSGSGGSHGGGSSCTQGVGLTLLMGNKYIPTYYDNINSNYMNMNNEPTPGVNGWKSNCPPRIGFGGSTPGPDCTKCGLVNGDVEPPSSYIVNTWITCGPSCTSTTSTDCQVMTPYGLYVHSHRCACGWHPEPELSPCNFGDIVEVFGLALRSLPGVIDGVISSGGGIGV
jgi:hypothetical protein